MALKATISLNEAQIEKLQKVLNTEVKVSGNDAGTKEITSGLGSMGKDLSKLIGPLLKMAAVASVLSMGFSGTIKMIGRLVKLATLILKPIDLLVQTIMMPLFWMLTPFLKAMMQFLLPFIKAFRKSLLGNKEAIASGEMTPAEAYIHASIAGITAMLLPLLEMVKGLGETFIKVAASIEEGIVNAIAGMLTTITDAIFDAITTMVSVVQEAFSPFIHWLNGDLGDTFDKAMNRLKEDVGGMKKDTETTIETWRQIFINKIELTKAGALRVWDDFMDALIDKVKESIATANEIRETAEEQGWGVPTYISNPLPYQLSPSSFEYAPGGNPTPIGGASNTAVTINVNGAGLDESQLADRIGREFHYQTASRMRVNY